MRKTVALVVFIAIFAALFPAFCVGEENGGAATSTTCDSIALGPLGIDLPGAVDILLGLVLAVIGALIVLRVGRRAD